MKLIVGLGNPGEKYQSTRHNIGFMVIDAICKKLNINLNKQNFDGLFFVNNDFILAKPLTYMNLSGDFVEKIASYYKINSNDILIIRDDLDIPLGKVKIKLAGGSGGHNGMKNIIEKMKTENINQLKIGIGRPLNKNMTISSFVLDEFKKNEIEIINKIIDNSTDAVVSSIYNGFKNTFNNFYRGKK